MTNHIDPARAEAFWASTPELERLHNYMVSLWSPFTWAVLAHTLANVASHIPPTVVAADGGNLNTCVGVVGRTGMGFSTTLHEADDLVRPAARELGYGTWQGYAERIYTQQRRGEVSFPFRLDSAYGLYEQRRRSGKRNADRYLDILDSAAIERPKDHDLAAGSYRVTWRESVYIGVNSKTHFAPENAAISARFLYAPLWLDERDKESVRVDSHEPVAVPPITLPDWSGVTGRVTAPAHTLTVNDPKRHKAAILLAAMHGRTAVTDTDWDNAAVVAAVSDSTYATMTAFTNKKASA